MKFGGYNKKISLICGAIALTILSNATPAYADPTLKPQHARNKANLTAVAKSRAKAKLESKKSNLVESPKVLAARTAHEESLALRELRSKFNHLAVKSSIPAAPLVTARSVTNSVNPSAGSRGTNSPRYVRQSVTFTQAQYVDNLNEDIYTFDGTSYAAQNIAVAFDFVDLESGYDYVRLYDQTGLCAEYTGNYASAFTSTTCTGPQLTISVYTDASVSGAPYQGFSINGFYVVSPPPTAVALASPTSIFVGDSVQFDGSQSSDKDGESLTYFWNFGDGTTSTQSVVWHQYTQIGNYNVQLTVTDTLGNTDSSQIAISVAQVPPPDAFLNINPTTTLINTTVSADGRSSSADATFETIDWGDGTTGSSSNLNHTFQHAYTKSGSYLVVLTVQNNAGLTDSDSAVVTVNLPQPTISGFSPSSGGPGTSVTITGSDFYEITAVTFGGAPATVFSASSGGNTLQVTVPAGATSGKIQVTNSQNAIATSTNDFLVPPQVSQVSPGSGKTGTPVTITGSNLLSVTSVTFKGTPAAITNQIATSLTVTVPDAAADGPIVLVNSVGAAVTALQNFQVIPTITSISPTTGDIGTVITVTGSGFFNAQSVTFSGPVQGTNLTVNDANHLHITVPPGTRSGSITVTAPGGTSNASPQLFNLIPVVTGASPLHAWVNLQITITGRNFLDVTQVSFPGVASTPFQPNANGTSLTVNVPVGATTGPIQVTSAGGSASTPSILITVPPATLTGALTPGGTPTTHGWVGEQITLTGTDFAQISSITFGGINATVPSQYSSTQLTVAVPANAQTGQILITNPGGTNFGALNFTITPPPPVIVSISPDHGDTGTPVTITGQNLDTVTQITFGGTLAPAPDSQTATQIVVKVPAGAFTGPIELTDGYDPRDSVTFHVAPRVTGIQPPSGPAHAIVTISGANFEGLPTVIFNNGAVSPNVQLVSPSQITAEVPVDAITGTVGVTTAYGTASSPNPFIVLPGNITFSPQGGVAGTTSVTITGTGFGGLQSVQFGGVTQTVFGAHSATSIQTTVPNGAVSGPITVITADGSGNSGTNYFLLPPVITGLSTTHGYPGQNITLQGTSFLGVNYADFNGAVVPAGGTVSVTSTSIVLTIPNNAVVGTGPIHISNGFSPTAASADFTVTNPPAVVTAVTPLKGYVGLPVVISGTGFLGVTSVDFNGTPAQSPHVDSTTQITVSVPAGATTGIIHVTNDGGISVQQVSFRVTPPPPVVSGFTPTFAAQGKPFQISGANFSEVESVQLGDITLSSTNYTVLDAQTINATVPTGALTAKITVTNSFSATTSNGEFFVTPEVDQFTLTAGRPGDTVVVTGSNFRADEITSVNFGAISTTVFGIDSLTQLHVTVPQLDVGKYVISTSGPYGGTPSTGTFTINPPAPTVIDFNPKQGKEGDPITITGTGLDLVTGIFFGQSVKAINILSQSPTQIVVAVPEKAGSGPIQLHDPFNDMIQTQNFDFLDPAPFISSISPTHGGSGTVVTIDGTDFRHVTAVLFGGGVPAATSSITVDPTLTTITVSSPVGALAGPITVVVKDGRKAVSIEVFTPADSTRLDRLTLRKMTPRTGPVGQVVNVTGKGFNSISAIYFSGKQRGVRGAQWVKVPALFTVLSDTEMSVTVPDGIPNGIGALTVDFYSLLGRKPEMKLTLKSGLTFKIPGVSKSRAQELEF